MASKSSVAATRDRLGIDRGRTTPRCVSVGAMSKRRSGEQLTTDLAHLIRSWGVRWELPGLEQRVRIEWSPRLRSSLGRAFPTRRLVRLGEALALGAPTLLVQTLCHEVAHVAVAELFPPGVKPHGAEWAALVVAVGFEPHVRTPRIGATLSPQPPRVARLYLHRCPVCQARRLARRRVPRWRCAACTAAGLPGQLEILPWP